MITRRALVGRIGIAAAVLIILAAAGYFLWSRPKPLDSLAILPFVNMGGDPGTDYLSDGIAESIGGTSRAVAATAPAPTATRSCT